MINDTDQQITGTKNNCQHFWIIEAPDGNTSIGRCRYCGVTKEFSNSAELPHREYRRRIITAEYGAKPKAAESRELKEIESEKAKGRESIRKGRQPGASVENLPHLETGKTRDIVARTIGNHRRPVRVIKGFHGAARCPICGALGTSEAAIQRHINYRHRSVTKDSRKFRREKRGFCRCRLRSLLYQTNQR